MIEGWLKGEGEGEGKAPDMIDEKIALIVDDGR